jgi:sialic acid synthase SpsE
MGQGRLYESKLKSSLEWIGSVTERAEAVMEIKIGAHEIGENKPTYFIADISANHDGDLERAKMLIHLAKEAGVDAAKFQNFRAPQIVSDYGFRSMQGQVSHQSNWKKTVFEVYQDASLPFEWTPILKDECDQAGIDYFSSPYDFEAIDMLDAYVPAYKIGSGDITWPEALERMARKGKPVILATGASEIGEVQRAVHCITQVNPQLVLMQCNTNYTASLENFNHIHLRVLNTYRVMFPNVILGLSDHTHGHATVLGAVALGARVIEKHFTDDNSRVGPDHPFSMTPASWRDMVDRTRELELALGSADKFVTANEQHTVIIQRRCLRAARDIRKDELITRDMIDVLRPATPGAITPVDIPAVCNTRALADIPAGKELRWTDLGDAHQT